MTTEANIRPTDRTSDPERPPAPDSADQHLAEPSRQGRGISGDDSRKTEGRAAEGPAIASPPSDGPPSGSPEIDDPEIDSSAFDTPEIAADPDPPPVAAGASNGSASIPAPAPSGPPAPHLEDAAAEFFAASFRPSWAPDIEPPLAPSAAPVPSSASSFPPRASVRPEIVGSAQAFRPVQHSGREELPKVALHSHRGRALAILAACMAAVAGLVYLSISSSSVRPDDPALAKSSLRDRSRSTAEHVADPESTNSAPAELASPPEPIDEPDPAPAPAADPAPEELQVARSEPAPAEPPPAEPPLSQPAPADTPQAQASGAEPQAALVADAPTTGTAATHAEETATAKPTEPAAEPAKPAPQPTAASAAAARAAEKPKQPTWLDVAAFPVSARLRFDGEPVDNPFRARLPRGSKHRLEAHAPGYAPETHQLSLEADARLMIRLKREATSAEPPLRVNREVNREVKRTTATTSTAARIASPAAKPRGAGFVSENPY